MDDVVHLSVIGGLLHIVMDRPPANALGPPMIAGLQRAVAALAEPEVRVAVITSAVPNIFAAGADIKVMAEMSSEEFSGYRDALREPIERLAACGKPTIAAIDGLALGGGLELAMSCTLRFASPQAKLGLPEVKLGLIPGAGGTQRLPRLVGRGRALEIMLSGRQVGAPEAVCIGLVDRLCDRDVASESLEFAARLASGSAGALHAIIACVDASDGPLDAGLGLEGAAVARAFSQGEAREGIAAFLENRRPAFA
jgi:enoyl-CoA hydratase/carnithine racemase